MTINKDELRRLAEAATPGPWIDSGCGDVEDLKKRRRIAIFYRPVQGQTLHQGFDGSMANASFIAAANPATILALLDELEAAQRDAERYRWLRKLPDFQFWTYAQFEDVTDTLDEQDAAIDAAMQEQKP